MSYSLNCLKPGYKGDYGSIIGVIGGDTGSLDNGSFRLFEFNVSVVEGLARGLRFRNPKDPKYLHKECRPKSYY